MEQVRATKKWRLTPRDEQILRHLGENGFSSARWIRRIYWDGKPNRNYYRRLSILRKQGYVEHMVGDGGTRLGYRLTKQGANMLRAKGVEVNPSGESRAVYKTSYLHDENLVGIASILRALPAVSEFQSEENVRRELAAKHGRGEKQGVGYKVPDALFKLHTKRGTFAVALELELAAKSLGYRRKILRKLVTSRDFDLVFLIVIDTKMLRRFRDSLALVRSKDLLGKSASRDNGIYFVLLSDLLANAAHAKFEGEETTFTLAQFSA